MCNLFTEGICPQIQQSITEAFGCMANPRSPVGLLDAVVSEANRATAQITNLSQNTGRRVVEVIWTQRATEDDVNDAYGPDDCIDYCSGRGVEPVSEIYTIDTCVDTRIEFNKNQLEKLCFESPLTFMGKTMLQQIDALNRKIERRLYDYYIANAGTFIDGSATKTWDPIVGTAPNRAVDEQAAFDALREYNDIGCMEMPFLVGGGDMSNFAKSTKIGCCNQNGIDLMQASGDFMYFYDNLIRLFKPNNVVDQYFVFAPGALQMIQWNPTNEELAGMMCNCQEEFTLSDPRNGLPYEVTRTYDPCTKKWVFVIRACFTFASLPTDLYNASDALFGTNGMLIFEHS